MSKQRQTTTRELGLAFSLGSLLLLGLPACAAEQGDVQFEVWGEEYIEDEIPEDEFEDGWSAKYDQFLVVIGNVVVADGSDVGGELSETRLYDLTSSGPHDVGRLDGLEAGQWKNVGYEIPQADDDTKRHGSASADDLEMMQDNSYSVFASGTVTNGDREFTFSWGFDGETRYEDCVDVRDGQQTRGIVISDGGSDTHQLTVHGDHLFYDDLAAEDAVLRFEALAQADTDGDGDVTLAELDDVLLSELSSDLGSYGVGAFDVDTLGDFVRASTTSLGHFDGEGHCSAKLR